MNRTLWIVLGLLGAVLIWLVINHENHTTLGLENENFARIAYLAVWGLVLAPAVLFGARLGNVTRNLAIWLFILLVLVAGYQYRFELQDIASRVSGGLIPGSPITLAQDGNGNNAVMIVRSDNGHFEAVADVNDRPVRFLVDTGATSTVLTQTDAEAIGLPVDELIFSTPIQTANGRANAARARINTIKIGTIRRENLSVLVTEDRLLEQSLLGMNFLNSLGGLDIRQDRLVLRD